MIKGCQKRVLWVKNIESDCFDGAFFIVSDRSAEKSYTEGSMVAEASRIISESALTNYFGEDEKRDEAVRLGGVRLRWLGVGVLLGTLISLLLQIF